MRDKQAHPVMDEQERVAVFHNGFVSNYKELARELFPHKDPNRSTLSDSELIALTLGKFLDQGMDIKTAIQTITRYRKARRHNIISRNITGECRRLFQRCLII